jgi:hypothetical protein
MYEFKHVYCKRCGTKHWPILCGCFIFVIFLICLCIQYSENKFGDFDLQNDFNKIVAKREAESLRLLPARLPLQKSVSTPSIIAVQDTAGDSTAPIVPS